MKSEIRERKSETSKKLAWYSWKETCDRCGNIIHGHEVETTAKPNMSESDYCIACLEHALKNNIRY